MHLLVCEDKSLECTVNCQSNKWENVESNIKGYKSDASLLFQSLQFFLHLT